MESDGDGSICRSSLRSGGIGGDEEDVGRSRVAGVEDEGLLRGGIVGEEEARDTLASRRASDGADDVDDTLDTGFLALAMVVMVVMMVMRTLLLLLEREKSDTAKAVESRLISPDEEQYRASSRDLERSC